jgi:hypothetical protein
MCDELDRKPFHFHVMQLHRFAASATRIGCATRLSTRMIGLSLACFMAYSLPFRDRFSVLSASLYPHCSLTLSTVSSPVYSVSSRLFIPGAE